MQAHTLRGFGLVGWFGYHSEVCDMAVRQGALGRRKR